MELLREEDGGILTEGGVVGVHVVGGQALRHQGGLPYLHPHLLTLVKISHFVFYMYFFKLIFIV